MKKSVTQEHGMGCAVACMAYVLNCTYQKALSFYEQPEHAWDRGFYCREIVTALQKAGILYAYKKIKTARDKTLKIPGTLVFIEKSKKYPEGHFFARTINSSWMNPWINFPLIKYPMSGFEKKLPVRPIYSIFPI